MVLQGSGPSASCFPVTTTVTTPPPRTRRQFLHVSLNMSAPSLLHLQGARNAVEPSSCHITYHVHTVRMYTAGVHRGDQIVCSTSAGIDSCTLSPRVIGLRHSGSLTILLVSVKGSGLHASSELVRLVRYLWYITCIPCCHV